MRNFVALTCLLLLAACADPQDTTNGAPASNVTTGHIDRGGAAEVESAAGSDWRQPLFEGLGDLTYPVSTSSSLAQQYFDQGLALAFAFNHAAADLAFTEATLADPDCGMCYWGSALVLGPNVNAAMAADNAARAHALATRAYELTRTASPREQALAEALLTRYAPTEPTDRSALDSAYADAMRATAARFADDPTILALTAEALMDLHPWNFWLADGEERPWTGEIVAMIEQALALDASHIGAIHLYIHAVEQSRDAARAEPYADRLADLAPAAGHLVHMPAHIYMRVGRYHDAVLNNQRAADADAAFVQVCRSNSPIYLAGYMPHNLHFGWISAAIAGWREQALTMAEDTSRLLSPDLLRAPDMVFAQHYLVQPLFAHLRFADWDDILAAPKPDADLIYAVGVWHYARGRALLGKGDLAGARAAAATLEVVRSDPAMATQTFFGRDGGAGILAIAAATLAGELALAEGDTAGAIAHLTRGVELEDARSYTEPPDWFYPVRHSLGFAQLQAGDPVAAEATYLADLDRMPENGWALVGLAQALRAQDRNAEADAVAARFERAWAHADTPIAASRL